MAKTTSKSQTYAGVCGLGGAIIAAIAASRIYDFSVTDQMQKGVGYILGGLLMGIFAGYALGKSSDRE